MRTNISERVINVAVQEFGTMVDKEIVSDLERLLIILTAISHHEPSAAIVF